MLKLSSLAVAAVCLCGIADAQTNRFEIYPQRGGAQTTFTTRFSLGAAGGEMFQGAPPSHFAGSTNPGPFPSSFPC